MPKIVCYDPQGNRYEKEPVDARECVEYCGYTLTQVPPPEIVTEDNIQNPEEVIPPQSGDMPTPRKYKKRAK